ncbi:MAG: hypothetical protein KF895_02095 [Parvibaculum sp.]|nr:hypothetical protein [Parvibaculum sp.]
MPEHLSRSAGAYRRIEPIFDASGALKRHAMSGSSEARNSEPADKGKGE